MARLPAKLPTSDDLGALPSARTGRVIATFDTSAIGKGMADMGRSISQLGGTLQEQQDRDAELTAERHLLEFENQQISRLDNERRTLTGDPAGFADRYRAGYDEGARELFRRVQESGASPRVLQRLDFGLQRRGAHLHTRAFDAEYDQRGRYQDDWSEEQLRGLQQQYVDATDDEARERIREQARQILEFGRRAGMTPAGERRLRENYLRTLPEHDARIAAQSDPLGVFEQLARGDQRANQPSTGELSETALGRMVEAVPRTPGQGPRSPAERIEIARRIQSETAPISAWIRKYVRVRGPNDTALPEDATNLTQLQHDMLVSYARRAGMDGLEELLPLINTGDFSSLVASRGNLTAMEQPVTPPPASERPPTGERRSDAGGSTLTAADREPEWRGPQTDAQSDRPGVIYAVTDQAERTARPGYGGRLTGTIVVNGNTYTFVNGGSRRGAIPFGDYRIGQYATAEQRRAMGRLAVDAFDLNNTADPEVGGAPRTGLLIHPARNTTAGCIGIQGNFAEFTRDVRAEIARNGGRPITLRLGSEGGDARVMRLGGDVSDETGDRPVRVAQARTGTMTDASPSGRATLPGDGRDRGLFNDEESEGLLNQAPARRFRDIPLDRRRVLMRDLAEGLRPQLHYDLHQQYEATLAGQQPVRDAQGRSALERAMSPAAPILTTQQLEKWRIKIESAERQRAAAVAIVQVPEPAAEEHLRRLPPDVRPRVERTWRAVSTARQRDPALAVEGGTIRGGLLRSVTSVGPDGEPVAVGDAETDLIGVPPSPEVAAARRIIRQRLPGVRLVRGADGELSVAEAAHPEITGGTDEDGNPAFAEAERFRGDRPSPTQEAWGTLIAARLAAQRRIGIPERDISPITRGEAADLIRMPTNRRPDPTEFSNILKAAADRAAARYGPYAQQVWVAAVGFARFSDGDQSQEALGMAYRLARGETITPEQMRQYMHVQNLDRERNAWLGTGPDHAPRWPGNPAGGRADFHRRQLGITRVGPGPDNTGIRGSFTDRAVDLPFIAPSLSPPNAFSGLRPNQPYTGPAQRQFETPTPEEIELLRRRPLDPEWGQEAFDLLFGPGEAAKYLSPEHLGPEIVEQEARRRRR